MKTSETDSIRIHLPGLDGPFDGLRRAHRSHQQALYDGLPIAGVNGVLKRCRVQPARIGGDSHEAQLCQLFGLKRAGGSDWPVGPLTLSLDRPQQLPAWCMRADPVHLEPDLRDVHLIPSDRLGLESNHSKALVADLNQHFEGQGWHFVAGAPSRWYLSGPEPLSVETFPPVPIPGRRLESLLPSGKDALALHRLMNEAQMVLHASSANSARTQAGLRPVNGVWCWGAGMREVLGRVSTSAWARVVTDERLAQALAKASGTECKRLNEPWWSGAGNVLVVSIRGAVLVRLGDVKGWRDWVAEMLAQVITPATEALRAGRFRQVVLSWGGPSECVVTRFDRWRLWRRGLSLADLSGRSARIDPSSDVH